MLFQMEDNLSGLPSSIQFHMQTDPL